jgi:hypothetical protein
MKAPMIEILFRLYIAIEDVIIGAVLMQVTDDKEHIITYLTPAPHRRRNKVFIHSKVMFTLVLCLLQITTLLAI